MSVFRTGEWSLFKRWIRFFLTPKCSDHYQPKYGSTAEEFLLAAKQSKKVKLYGVTTMGVLDFSNMYFVESPDKDLRLGYCLSKSHRVPDMGIDGKGIAPDFYLDRTIPDEQWLTFVQNVLEEKE